MPRRKYSNELWERCKALFVSGISIRQIASKCGIPAGTLAARCNREGWNDQRKGIIEAKAQMIPPEERAQEIANVVAEARLATLQLEARVAHELAKKALAAVQGKGVDLENLEDMLKAQAYRLNIWPTPKPADQPEVRQTVRLNYGHELKNGENPAFCLKWNKLGQVERCSEKEAHDTDQANTEQTRPAEGD